MNYNILNEKWIESLPEEVEKLFREISLEITAVICQRIKAVGRLSKTDIIRLTNAYQYYGADIKKISEIISGVTGKSEKAVLSILKKAVEESDSFAEVFYSARNIKPLSYLSDSYLSSTLYSIAEQTNNQFKNLSKSTLYYKAENNKLLPVNEMYTRAIDKAIYEVRNGTVDYNTAMRKTVRQLGGGLYIYESGKKIRLDSAVRMNLLDSVRQLNQKTLDYHGKQFGSDGVELSAHAISAPDHAPVQGHQFRNEEFEKMQSGYMSIDVNGVVYDGFERPIGQWNCKHFAFPIVVGVSSPAYTEEELANMRENSKQKYDLTQQQRKYELQLRKLKDEKTAQEQAGFDLDARETGLKIRKLQKEYKAFSEKNGLRYSPERARVPKPEKNTQISLTTASNNDIIKSIKISGALNPYGKAADKHAVQYYEFIRKIDTDVKRISENTGIPQSEIAEIKDFLFKEEHLLGGELKRFDANYMMAQSWQRLFDGKNILPHDMTMLYHEQLERKLMKEGLTQDEAHREASAKYNYDKESNEYYGTIKKYKKE